MNYNQILLAVSALWVASEVVLGIRRRSASGDDRQDARSLRLLWIGICMSITAAAFAQRFAAFRMPFAPAATLTTGVATILAGIALRWAAILTLGRYFTVDVAIRDGHKIVDHGMYATLRHPSYSGALLSFLGLGIAYRNWLSLALIVVGTFAALSYRIAIEERALRSFFGEAYDAYARRTKRLIPGVY